MRGETRDGSNGNRVVPAEDQRRLSRSYALGDSRGEVLHHRHDLGEIAQLGILDVHRLGLVGVEVPVVHDFVLQIAQPLADSRLAHRGRTHVDSAAARSQVHANSDDSNDIHGRKSSTPRCAILTCRTRCWVEHFLPRCSSPAFPASRPPASSPPAPGAVSLTDDEFSRLIHQISEEGGYFWSNNYISNETSYLHVLDDLEKHQVKGGVYVGVGPNQNFTYIAAVEPDLAFIVDIRRQNLLEHLLFKALIEKSTSREEYLARLLGRPLDRRFSASTPLPEIVAAVEGAPPDESYFKEQLAEVELKLRGIHELGLTDSDFEEIRQIHSEFFRQGFEIKYDSWRSFFFPSLKEFILETDLNGRHRNWLASVEDFEYVREMQLANRIVPIVGDFAGEQAFRRLGRVLESRGATVSAFYLSNVEFYLFRQRKWPAFVDNVRELPTDEHSVFIRAYANLHRPHPKMVDDHITVSLVQNIHAFLRNAREGRYHSLWDVVTVEEEDF